MTKVLQPDLVWRDGAFHADAQVAIGADGRIEAVGALGACDAQRLDRCALLPGFVNAHSHAFQRGLRGRGEAFPAEAGSFWSWREAMYDLVEALDPDSAYALSRQAFGEMLRAGMTTVGEFHYLHHAGPDADWRLDDAVRAAARDAGIRLALLQAYYVTGEIGAPLGRGQRRFDGGSVDAFLAQLDAVAARLDGARETVGVVAHSIRAVPVDDLVRLHAAAEERGIVLHMHVEEQRREIESSLARLGAAPMALINERLAVSGRFTAVHCTHTAEADMEAFARAGGITCICPLTEANLGDGLADVEVIRRSGGRVCLGSDSNARISMLEEMRWLEYGQRLRRERRGVVRGPDGRVAPELIDCATRHGAEALGIEAGAIEPGAWADFVGVALDHPTLEGSKSETLAESLVFGASDDALDGAWVGGRRVT